MSMFLSTQSQSVYICTELQCIEVRLINNLAQIGQHQGHKIVEMRTFLQQMQSNEYINFQMKKAMEYTQLLGSIQEKFQSAMKKLAQMIEKFNLANIVNLMLTGDELEIRNHYQGLIKIINAMNGEPIEFSILHKQLTMLKEGIDTLLQDVLEKSFHKQLNGKNPMWKSKINISELTHQILSVDYLVKLDLNLSWTNLNDVSELSKCIGKLKNLQIISLNLQYDAIETLDPLVQEIEKLENVEEINLNLKQEIKLNINDRNTQLRSVKSLFQLLLKSKTIRKLNINLIQCEFLPENLQKKIKYEKTIIKFLLQMDNKNSLTEDDISKVFDEQLKLCMQYEEQQASDDSYIHIIEQLQSIQQAIIKHAVFSPNERFEDINTENLKYIFLPYYLAFCFGKIQNQQIRKKNLEYSEFFYDQFMKLLDHYDALPKKQKQFWKSLMASKRKAQIQRDDKIANYKEKKELDLKLKNLEKLDDEKSRRQVVLLQFNQKIIDSIDNVVMNWQEMEVLDYKEKLQKDPKMAEQFKKDQEKPVPKLSVWHIPKPQKEDQPYLMNQEPMCHHCQTESEMRQQLVTKVWTPGHSVPTMTLEEFADMEIAMAKKQEQSAKKVAEEQKQFQEALDDDKEEQVDQKTLEERHWDDWKDAHEKGAGNKMK